MSPKNTILNAERHYNNFINQTNDWNFFLGLAEYSKFLIEDENAEIILNKIADQRIKEEDEIASLAAKSIIEMNKQANKLIGIIRQENLNFPNLETAIQKYKKCEINSTYSSQPLSYRIFENLVDIINVLVKNKYVEKIKDFVSLQSEPNMVIEGDKYIAKGIKYQINYFTFSNAFLKYEKAKNIFENKRDIEIWGVWGHLLSVYYSIFKSEEWIVGLKKDKKIWEAKNVGGLVGEMKKIKSGEGGSGANGSYVFFKRQIFMRMAARFHNYLIKELSLVDNRDYTERNNNRISYQYNEPIGNLTIGDFKPVEFKKIPAKILNYLYSNNKLGNEYKNYNDFNRYAGEDLSSDKFNKAVGEINKRIISDTKFNKVMIESGNTKPPQTKIFRWNN